MFTTNSLLPFTLTLSTLLPSLPFARADATLDTFNKYRAIMNVPALSHSDVLQANVQKTLDDHPGQMVHELNPGTLAQVLAQGDCADFESALKYGWICEIPSLLPPGSCDGSTYDYGGQTEHAEIVSSTDYTQVACACEQGIWGCDLA